MNQHRLPSDVIGLSKVMTPLSRRGFMSSSAAAAAGYTLAAGPVRADAIQTVEKSDPQREQHERTSDCAICSGFTVIPSSRSGRTIGK